MIATVKKWGNSYAIRMTKADMQRIGVRPGQAVEVMLRPIPFGRVDVSGLPTFSSNETLEQALQAYAEERVARWQHESR